MTIVTTKQELRGADKSFGYVFGCEGLAPLSEVSDLLGVGRDTLDRYAADGKIRKGKHGGGKVVFCRRSVREYIARLEI